MSRPNVTIGKMRKSNCLQYQLQNFIWIIPNFESAHLNPRSSKRVSPSFTFKNTSLHLVLSENDFVFLCYSKDTPISDEASYNLFLKNICGDLIGRKTFTSINGKTMTDSLGFSVQEVLTQNQNVLKPTKELTIVCQLYIYVTETIKIENRNKESATESLDNLQFAGDSAFHKGLKDMLLNNKHSDFVLNVKEKEFRVHKIILAARSPVFAAMFEHDMKEKKTNSLNLEDCEPDIFSDFLNFLYAGEIESFNSDKALDLYEVADKYQVTELSELCEKYMVEDISMENILDILNLGLQFHVKELIEAATQFFLQNSKEIAISAKWITFMAKNPVAANELFLKTLDLKK